MKVGDKEASMGDAAYAVGYLAGLEPVLLTLVGGSLSDEMVWKYGEMVDLLRAYVLGRAVDGRKDVMA